MIFLFLPDDYFDAILDAKRYFFEQIYSRLRQKVWKILIWY